MYNPAANNLRLFNGKYQPKNRLLYAYGKALYSSSFICALSSKKIGFKYCIHYSGIFSVEYDGVINFAATNIGKTTDAKKTDDLSFRM